ncbi:MAG: FAD-dependent oxidoreductase, partial [Chloroflexota bacterium]|nr:FAD-dependent oxidoreductase [Chloroflexota bacterium]
GWEETMSLTPTSNPKTVVIVGGGPAGLEAARVAALRGHRVTLYEERPELGGQMLLAARPPGKGEFIEAIRYLEQEVTRLGVSVALGRSATAAEVMGQHPQAVVIATGALPLRPPFPGADGPYVSTAWEVLEGKATAGERVIVIGGGSVGLETAHFLAAQGKRVTVVEMLPHWGADMGRIARWYLRQRLEELGVDLVRSTRVEEIKGRRVKVAREGEEETMGDFDTVALAMGARPRRELASELKGQVPELHVIGDALKPRRALEAIADGARVGRLI